MKNLHISGSRTVRSVISCLLAICMLLPALGASAQSGNDSGLVGDSEYDLLTGNVLTWGDPWTVVDDQTGFDSGFMGDYIVLLDDEASRIDFYSTPSIGSVQSNLDFIASAVGYAYDNGELVEHEATKKAGHSILRFTSGSAAYAAYIDMQSTSDLSTLLITILIAPEEDIADVIASAQDAIELDRDPFLGAIDGDEVQGVADDGKAIDFPIAQSQFSNGEDDSSDDGENEDIKLPDDDEIAPTATPEDFNSAIDPAEFGLVDETTYDSPQFGTEVLWSEDWEADTSLLSSDVNEGVDRVALDNGDFDATLYLSFYDSGEVSPEDWAQSFVDTFDTADSTLTILDQDSQDGIETFYYRMDGDDGSQFGIVEARASADGDVTVVVELLGSQDDVRDAFSSAEDDITIDGDDLFQDFSRFPRITKSDLG